MTVVTKHVARICAKLLRFNFQAIQESYEAPYWILMVYHKQVRRHLVSLLLTRNP